jgi:hypothetical protein
LIHPVIFSDFRKSYNELWFPPRVEKYRIMVSSPRE